MAIENLQLKLSNLEYLNKDEALTLFEFIFNNKLTQLEFNNILNSLNCRVFNNLEPFSCIEFQALYFYLDSKLNLNYQTISQVTSGSTANYYAVKTCISTPFNLDLFVSIILGAYFIFKADINKFSIYDIKYSDNSCKNDYYFALNSKITLSNFLVSNNPLTFFSSFNSLFSNYKGDDVLSNFLKWFITYTPTYVLRKYAITNSIAFKTYLSNTLDSNLVVLDSADKLFEVSSTSVIEKMVNYKWTPLTLTTTLSHLQTEFNFSLDYNSLIMQGLSKDYTGILTLDYYVDYVISVTSIILSDIYNLGIDAIHTDIVNNMILTNKLKTYLETGTIS